jgi:dolichyl-phosphate-mannose--protein O-mannosyl transferase
LPKSQSLTDKLNFIVENPENILVKAAKKSKIVSTIKSDKNIVDTSKYIDIKSLENLAENLKNIDEKFKISNEEVNTFLNKTKALKVGSVMANIGISCLFLGYLIPKAVYKYREIKTGTTKFHVEEDIRNNNAK